MALILKLIAGIVLGILCGLYAPHALTQLLLTFKALFGQLLFFVIPLLILFFITSCIAALPRNSGKLLSKTLAIAYGSTIVAGTLAFIVASIVVPMLTTSASAAPAGAAPSGAAGAEGTSVIESLRRRSLWPPSWTTSPTSSAALSVFLSLWRKPCPVTSKQVKPSPSR